MISNPQTVISRYSYQMALILMTVFAALWTNKEHWSGDFFTHAAAVQELTDNLLDPSHPIIVSEKSHPFFSPYTLMVALLSKTTSLSALSSLSLFGMLNFFLFMGGFYFFAGFFFSRHRSFFVAASLALVLFLWGGEPFFWSGFSHFISFWSVLPYPSTFCISLFFILTGVLLRVGEPPKPFLFLMMIASAVFLLVHPNTWLCWVPLILSIRFRIHGRSILKSLGFTALVAAPGLALACLWPYFSFFDLVFHPDPLYHQHSLALYDHPLTTLWPLLFSIPAFVIAKRDPVAKMLASGILMLMLSYCVGRFTRYHGFGRTVSAAMVLGQLLIVYALYRADHSKTSTKIYSAVIYLALLVCVCVNFQAIREQARIALTTKQTNYYSRFAFAKQLVKRGDCIMAPESASNILPAFGARVVGNSSPLYWVRDAVERRHAISAFYKEGASREHRSELLTKFGCSFFLIADDSGSAVNDAYRMGTLVYDSGGVKLFECKGQSVKM